MNANKVLMLNVVCFLMGVIGGNQMHKLEYLFERKAAVQPVREIHYDDDNSREIMMQIEEERNKIDYLDKMEFTDRYREYLQEEERIIQEKDMSDCSEFDRWEK